MKNIYLLGVLSFALSITACKSDKATEPVEKAVETNVQTPAPNLGVVKSIKLVKAWESDSTSLVTPESVYFDEGKGIYYVSCIGNVPPSAEDGDGYIATLDQRGNVINAQWIKGFDAPKGMAILGGKMYVADINEIVIVDIESASIERRIKVPGATFLNDVAAAPDGQIYFTDSNENTIYVYADDKVQLYKRDKGLGGSNGIFVDDETIYLAAFGTGDIHTIEVETKEMTKRATGVVPGGDGIAPWQGGYVYSNWNGEVYYVNSQWEAEKVLDTKSEKANAADITINQKTSELLVPTFFDNRVVSYKIESIR